MNLFDVSWMVGSQVKLSFTEPDFWSFELGNSLRINAECPWRLIHGGNILVSSIDHGQQFGLPAPIDAGQSASKYLSGALVSKAEVKKGTLDLVLEFNGDYRLEIVPFSSGYESWKASGPKGRTIVACGGGELNAHG